MRGSPIFPLPRSKPSADDSLVAIWRRRGVGARLLFPLSLCFHALVALRRALYRRGGLKIQRLPVPVVIVGNLTVGGAGKTPLIVHLTEVLRARGLRPGIISRGYGSRSNGVLEVTANSDPASVGDEPVLLARRSRCPVFVGIDRVAAARSLLAAYPECGMILADDGLQHYRLARDIEIAVFDARGVMNGWFLPAGPLREPVARLAEVDAVVLNEPVNEFGVSPAPTFGRPVFTMRLMGETFYRLDDPHIICRAEDLADQRLHAVAGIGAPQRFFDTLTALGLVFETHPFPDHHAYRREDFAFSGNAVLTTEKDAVKLAALALSLPVWVLPVTANVSPDLAAFILEKLNGPSPA